MRKKKREERKKHWPLLVGAVIALTMFLFPALASAEEKIDSFAATIEINADASITVTEHITYDFGEAQRHGIFRTIPTTYDGRGGRVRVYISRIDVTDSSRAPRLFATSTPGRDFEIKIGDPDELITGPQTYVIRYTVTGALNYFADHDELYWNVTGDEWEVAVANVAARVVAPGMVAGGGYRAACFAGSPGSSVACDALSQQEGSWLFEQRQLAAGEGLTVVVGWPKGLVDEPTQLERLWHIVRDNWLVGVPVATFVGLWFLWWTRGRDPAGRGTVVPQYGPPGDLSPAEVGTIIDEHAENVDLTADIIDLAVRGYLRIVQEEQKKLIFTTRDYRLIKLQEVDEALRAPQHLLLEQLFADGKEEVALADLKQAFHAQWRKVRKAVYASVTADGYFRRNPQTVRIGFAVGGLIVAFGGGGLGVVSGGLIGGASLLISGLLIVMFGLWAMPVKTKKGVTAKEYILGLKRYLSVAEKERLQFHNAPEKKPEHFDALLPYAMVLGVEKEWAKQFAGLDRESPGWYQGAGGGRLAAAVLVSDLSSFSSAAGKSLAASASSGSSGFSGGGVGGGFGGGGGGSW